MPRRPLIYLDSSDYLDFSATNCPSPKKEVHRYLLEKVQLDEIDIAFSFFIVGEVLREFNLKHFDNRLVRAQTVMALTKGLTFRHPIIDPQAPLSTEGIWFPDVSLPDFFSPQNLNNRIRAEIEAALKEKGAPRAERRCALSRANLRRQLQNLPDKPESFSSSMPRLDVPFEVIEKNTFRDLALGRISTDQAEKTFQQLLTNLELMVRAMSYTDDQYSIRTFVSEVYAHVDHALNNLEKLFSEASEKVKSTTELYRKLKRENLRDTEVLRQAKEIRRISERNFLEIFGNIFSSAASAEYTFPNQIAAAYVQSQLRPQQTRQSSDVVDIFHASYLPYCNLWRGDGTFSQTLIDADVDHNAKIVPSILDLPNRIEALLKKM